MAVYQLGAIVTKIKGSIGGTTFKTQRTTNVVMRKSNGYSRAKLLSNQALQYARWIFTRWSSLSPEEQSGWQNMAAIVFFPDKFGNQVHITGRQLFTKTNINLRNIVFNAAIPVDFSMTVPVVNATLGTLDLATQSLSLPVELLEDGTAYLEVSAEISLNPLPAPSFARRQAIFFEQVTGISTLSLGSGFFNLFPYVREGYNVRLYVVPVNLSGIKGLPLAVPVQFEPLVYYFNPSPYRVELGWQGWVVLNSNFPDDQVCDLYIQTSDVSMPEPDFENAIQIQASGVSNIDTVTAWSGFTLLPAGLRYGNYVRLWVAPRPIGDQIFEPVSVIWNFKPEVLVPYEPVFQVLNEDYTVSTTIETLYPVGTQIRVYAQKGLVDYPNPDAFQASLIGNYELESGGIVNVTHEFNTGEFNVLDGDKIVLLYQPWENNFPLDAALPLNLVYEPVVEYNRITGATFTITPSGGEPVLFDFFEENQLYDANSGDVVLFEIVYSNWVSGDPVPNTGTAIVTIVGVGDYPLAALTSGSTIEFNDGVASWLIEPTIDLPAYTINIASQLVSDTL